MCLNQVCQSIECQGAKHAYFEKVLCVYQGSGEESVLRPPSRALRTCYIIVSSVKIIFAEEAIRGNITWSDPV